MIVSIISCTSEFMFGVYCAICLFFCNSLSFINVVVSLHVDKV